MSLTSELPIPIKWYTKLYGVGTLSTSFEVTEKASPWTYQESVDKRTGLDMDAIRRLLQNMQNGDQPYTYTPLNITKKYFTNTCVFYMDHTKIDLKNKAHSDFWLLVMETLRLLDKVNEKILDIKTLDAISDLFVKEGTPEKEITFMDKTVATRTEHYTMNKDIWRDGLNDQLGTYPGLSNGGWSSGIGSGLGQYQMGGQPLSELIKKNQTEQFEQAYRDYEKFKKLTQSQAGKTMSLTTSNVTAAPPKEQDPISEFLKNLKDK